MASASEGNSCRKSTDPGANHYGLEQNFAVSVMICAAAVLLGHIALLQET